MLGPIYKLWWDILVQYFSENILGCSAVVLVPARQSQRVFYKFVIQQRLTRLQSDRHACAVYLDQKIIWERCLRVGQHHVQRRVGALIPGEDAERVARLEAGGEVFKRLIRPDADRRSVSGANARR